MTEIGGALRSVSDAVLGIAGDLSLDVVLERLVGAARDLVDARYAALGVPDEDGAGFARFITAGMSEEVIESMGPLPRTHGLLGAMLVDPEPFRTADVTADARFQGYWPATHPRMRSFLGVPIVFKGDVIGAFYLTDKRSGDSFTEGDEALVSVLAAHAAVLIEHARLYEQSRELSVLDERNRLARELHDSMTQALFGLRLRVETATSLVASDAAAAAAELTMAKSVLDALSAELRALIFELRPAALDADGLAATVRKHLDVVGRAHGLAVSVDADDPGAATLPADVQRELFRIVQEAVTNVVRHAGASRVAVTLDVAHDDRVRLVIVDDGAGFDPTARAIRGRRLGVTSMRERAHSLGGTLRIESAPRQGTTVIAEVPRARR